MSIDDAYLGIERGTYRGTLEAEKEAERQGHSLSLIMVGSASSCLHAYVEAAKGPHDALCRRVATDLDNLGHREIVFKNDQEPAIVNFTELVKASWNVSMSIEYSPVGDSAMAWSSVAYIPRRGK